MISHGVRLGPRPPGGGAPGTLFCPDKSVTRAENITFTYRHQTLVIDPLLDDMRADITAAEAEIAAMPEILLTRIAHDGTLIQTNAGATVSYFAVGIYDVEFGVDISECYWSATAVTDTTSGVRDINVMLNQDFDFPPPVRDTSEINVVVTDSSGAAIDARVDLILHC